MRSPTDQPGTPLPGPARATAFAPADPGGIGVVVCHSHLVFDPTNPNDRGSAQLDVLRVDGTRIVEHWVAWTAIPDTDPVNTNTMF